MTEWWPVVHRDGSIDLVPVIPDRYFRTDWKPMRAQLPAACRRTLAAIRWRQPVRTCMVCGRDRPSSRTSVAHRPSPWFLERFPALKIDVWHCNDRAYCEAIANQPGPWQTPPGRFIP